MHYICTGEDKGVSETPGVCQGENCSKKGQPLLPCDCTDNNHYGRQATVEEEKNNISGTES